MGRHAWMFAVLPGVTACAQIAGIEETSGGDRSSLTITRLSLSATVERTPQDLAGLEASYLVPDATQPDGLRRIPALLESDGTKWSAAVPGDGAPILFTTPDEPPQRRIVALPTRTVQYLYTVYEHPGSELAPTVTQLRVNATLPTPYAATETFRFFSVGTWNTKAWTDPLELPAPGATMFTPAQFSLKDTSKAPDERPYAKITTADSVLVLRYDANKLIGVLEAMPFDQTTDDVISGSILAVTSDDRMLATKLQTTGLDERFKTLRPAVTAGRVDWALRASPGAEAGYVDGPALNAGQVSFMDMAGIVMQSYGNPFTAKSWPTTMVASATGTRTYTAMGSPPATLGAGLTQVADPSTATFTLPAPLPELITLGGRSLSMDGMTVMQPSQAVPVTFVPGTGATPTLCQIELIELVPNSPQSTALVGKRVLTYLGVEPQVLLPPEVLEVGKTYTLRATTIVGGHPGIADGDLTQRELARATAFMDSGVFKVVAP